MDQFKSEHEILQFWNSINAFETQLEKTKDYPEYIFYGSERDEPVRTERLEKIRYGD